MGILKIFPLILALLGCPLFVVIAALALVAYSGVDIDWSVIFIEMSRLAETPMLISLPLFIFAGVLLAESNVATRLVTLSRVLFGWLPGGLAVISLLICAVFTAFTGASGVTIFAVGGLLFPALLKDRYSERFSLGLLTSSGSLGLLFPPSLPLILYGVISGARIEHLFLAGILPGMVMLALLGGYCVRQGGGSVMRGRKRAEILPGGTESAGPLAALKAAAWELPLPPIILGGIYGGYFVASEAAAITALYVLVVEVFIYKDVPLPRVPAVMVRSMVLFGGILVILGISLAATNFLVDQEVPDRLFSWLQQYITSKYTFLLVLNIFLLLVGSMLDIFSALVLVVPIIIPIAQAYGIDLVHLGIIFLTNLQIGYCTPPVGLNLFLASYRFERPVTTLYRATLPFLGILLVCLAIISYVPLLSLFLVELWGGG